MPNLVLYAAVIVAVVSAFVFTPSFAQQQSSSNNNNYSFLTKWGSSGLAQGQFKQPLEIAVDPDGNVYVTDFTSIANLITG